MLKIKNNELKLRIHTAKNSTELKKANHAPLEMVKRRQINNNKKRLAYTILETLRRNLKKKCVSKNGMTMAK